MRVCLSAYSVDKHKYFVYNEHFKCMVHAVILRTNFTRTSSFVNFSNGGSASAVSGKAAAAATPTNPLTNLKRDSGAPSRATCSCGLFVHSRIQS